MVRILSRTTGWALLFCAMMLGGVAGHRVPADPTDDFSFAHATAEVGDDHHRMSEEDVAAILRDYLKGYTREEIPRLARHLLENCRKYSFDPAFILSLIQAESGFRVDVVSYAGAVGLMQLMPATAHIVASRNRLPYSGEESLKDPFVNLSLGVAYLYELRERYRGLSPYFHVAAYNLGPAKLDELRKRETFKPVATKVYYEKIRKGVTKLRFYRPRGLV